jgi:NAD(P)-dependent dehydrogenase (short-subunit alcohol dehydrogenase family)
MPVVLLTGAASGIGAATARAFARAGDAIVLGDRNEEGLQQIAAELRADGSDVIARPCDVRNERETDALIDTAVDRHGSIDVVCTIAGLFVGPERPLEETGDDILDQLFDVNVKGVVHVLRSALPHLRTGASVILTSSISGLVAHPGGAVYAASKTAQIGLARSLAAELAPRRIRVNVICPGTIDTPMAHAAHTKEQLDGFAAANPMGRLGRPEDVADAFLFLARAEYVNGMALRVDGGDCLLGAL